MRWLRAPVLALAAAAHGCPVNRYHLPAAGRPLQAMPADMPALLRDVGMAPCCRRFSNSPSKKSLPVSPMIAVGTEARMIIRRV